jgi:hypothetical protein
VTNTSRVLLKYAAFIFLIVFCLYHNLNLVRNSTSNYVNRAIPDPITAFERRFELLKARLSNQGIRKVGYITDMPEVADWFTEYFRTQYALAPVVVENSTDCRFVVANLHDPSTITRIIREQHITLEENYGEGVLLLARK